MVDKEQIYQIINSRLTQVLLFAESSLSESQFQAFRKLTLDQFGKSGLYKDLDLILRNMNHKER